LSDLAELNILSFVPASMAIISDFEPQGGGLAWISTLTGHFAGYR